MYVFVYGTLKKGEPNEHLMNTSENGTCKYIGKGATEEKYPLVVASRYNIPFLLYKPGTGHPVEGEIYEVDDEKFKELDRLESNTKLYDRTEIGVLQVANELGDAVDKDTTITCWCYCLVKYRQFLLERQFLKTYTDNKNEKYVRPSDRENNGPSFWSEVHNGYDQKKD